MPASVSWLLEIFKDSTGHWNWPWIGAALVAAGGGIATAIGGIWSVFKFFAERKKADDKKSGDTKVTQSGQRAASGRDTNIGVQNIGPSSEYLVQVQRSHAEQLATQNAQIAAKDARITELTNMLLESYPGAAGPSAQQAVGEAVQSIAEGAAEGDSRLQQALALLKANKIAEAEPLLKAFAEDKTARAEQDRKEAAIAYRNLGAIAGLRDPKAAREAYARDVALTRTMPRGLHGTAGFSSARETSPPPRNPIARFCGSWARAPVNIIFSGRRPALAISPWRAAI
jgi:hypothetical protein